MITRKTIQFIRSLQTKKERDRTGLFVAEGNKLVADLLPFFPCELLLARPAWIATQGDLPARELIAAEAEDIQRASSQKNPQDVIAIFRQAPQTFRKEDLSRELILATDGIQDPGNLGTILRLAHWFGIRQIVCSPDTADLYNPKTVQASMGSLAHIRACYTPLPELLDEIGDTPLYGTFLDGQSLYDIPLTPTGILVMGNEGRGIRPEVAQRIPHRIHIPSYPPGRPTAESLNVAAATAIVCAEFRRRSPLPTPAGAAPTGR
jgi:TrmH family RNA methyltransferase